MVLPKLGQAQDDVLRSIQEVDHYKSNEIDEDGHSPEKYKIFLNSTNENV